MCEYMGRIVQACAGRDKGELFLVVGVEAEGGRLLLANGKRRKAATPKAKKLRHVRFPNHGEEYDHPAIQKLKQGEPVSDREIRGALAAFKEGFTLG